MMALEAIIKNNARIISKQDKCLQLVNALSLWLHEAYYFLKCLNKEKQKTEKIIIVSPSSQRNTKRNTKKTIKKQ